MCFLIYLVDNTFWYFRERFLLDILYIETEKHPMLSIQQNKMKKLAMH